MLKSGLELSQCGGCEVAQRGQTLQLTVAATNGNDRHDRSAALRRVLDGADRPVDGLRGRHVRRAEQHEHPQIDAMLREKRRGGGEAPEVKPLVESRLRAWMNCLESDRDLDVPSGWLIVRRKRYGGTVVHLVASE